MSNIQQFLEEEYKQVVTDFSKETLHKTIEAHDTRLINFILGEVERGLPKTKYEEMTNKGMQALGWNECLESVSTIITNLRVK